MDLLEQYFERSKEIIGDRTQDEIKYDNEVLRWLRKGKNIKKAISKANEKYPNEALQVSQDALADVAEHYDYLLKHEEIMKIHTKL